MGFSINNHQRKLTEAPHDHEIVNSVNTSVKTNGETSIISQASANTQPSINSQIPTSAHTTTSTHSTPSPPTAPPNTPTSPTSPGTQPESEHLFDADADSSGTRSGNASDKDDDSAEGGTGATMTDTAAPATILGGNAAALAAEAEAKHAASVAYLTGLLNKQLLVTARDGRLFLGKLKCTDRDRNMILESTYEYRQPTTAAIDAARASKLAKREMGDEDGDEKVDVDMTSRYLGLVTIPGEHIVKIALQEFASQVKG